MIRGSSQWLGLNMDWGCSTTAAWKKMLWGKRRDSCKIVASINLQLTELRMQKPHDNSKASPAAFMPHNTLIAGIELSLSNWPVAGLIPCLSREPRQKLAPN